MCVAGLGNNFLYTTVVVAVLECFGDKRMLIVIFTFVAQFIIEFILMLISVSTGNFLNYIPFII